MNLRPHSLDPQATIQLPPEVRDYLAKNATRLFGRYLGSNSWLLIVVLGLGSWAFVRYMHGDFESTTIAAIVAAVVQWLHVKLGVDKSGLTWGSLFSRKNREALYEFATRAEVQAILLPKLPPEVAQVLTDYLGTSKPMNTPAPTSAPGKQLASILGAAPLEPLVPPATLKESVFQVDTTTSEPPRDIALGEDQLVTQLPGGVEPPLPPARTRPLVLPKVPLVKPEDAGLLAEPIKPLYAVGDTVLITPIHKELKDGLAQLSAGTVTAVAKTMIVVELLNGEEKVFHFANNIIWKPA